MWAEVLKQLLSCETRLMVWRPTTRTLAEGLLHRFVVDDREMFGVDNGWYTVVFYPDKILEIRINHTLLTIIMKSEEGSDAASDL